ncbi:transcription termination factor [Tasmannia lanceolata]|uniref:transcription termination factor n=1 Tax=Tasmannia lanceolata TaxID=3420 RepID=UPI00406376CC
MLQFPAFMPQFPSPTLIPSSVLLPSQWPPLSQNDDLLLVMEESDLEDKWNEIRKTNSNLVVIGKTILDNDKEDFDPDADDDDADHVEESDGEEFEQETG